MSKVRLTQRKRLLKRSSGQTLVLAVMIFVIVLLAICLLFDVQSLLHDKIKGQSAADAAAIAGANWQMNTLNMIGELNLVKASTVLISEPLWGINAVPEEFTLVPDAQAFTDKKTVRVRKLKTAIEEVEAAKEKLRIADGLISQLQTRLSFAGPLIGFGAAQQAAKKNGAEANYEAGLFIKSMCGMLEDGGIYANENVAPQVINGYSWRRPYHDMLYAILCSGNSSGADDVSGIAAVPVINCVGMPVISIENAAGAVSEKQMLEFALARYWCGLTDVIDAGGLPDLWWEEGFSVNSSFIGQSEILPVHVAFTPSSSPYYLADSADALDDRIAKRFDNYAASLSDVYDRRDPYPYECDEAGRVTAITLHFRNDVTGEVTEKKVSADASSCPVPEGYTFISDPEDGDLRYDVIPELSWCIFDSYWRAMNGGTKDEWESYLDKQFQDGKDYYYGGPAYFKIAGQPNAVTGRFGEVPDVMVTASARPFGVIKDEKGRKTYPFACSMVLPVFTDTALVPVALETPEGYDACDLGFLYYATEFLPFLMSGDETGKFSTVGEAVKSFAENCDASHYSSMEKYARALLLLSDPEFIAEGKEYLDTVVETTDVNGTASVKRRRDFCGHGTSAGRGHGGSSRTRSGPGSLH